MRNLQNLAVTATQKAGYTTYHTLHWVTNSQRWEVVKLIQITSSIKAYTLMHTLLCSPVTSSWLTPRVRDFTRHDTLSHITPPASYHPMDDTFARCVQHSTCPSYPYKESLCLWQTHYGTLIIYICTALHAHISSTEQMTTLSDPITKASLSGHLVRDLLIRECAFAKASYISSLRGYYIYRYITTPLVSMII